MDTASRTLHGLDFDERGSMCSITEPGRLTELLYQAAARFDHPPLLMLEKLFAIHAKLSFGKKKGVHAGCTFPVQFVSCALELALARSITRTESLQVLRQVARESEADFLCSVIPELELELEGESEHNGQPSDYRSIIGPEQRSSFSSAVGEVRGEAGRRSLAKSPAENGGSDISSIADATAVARWESLQRLQQQSLGLGNAAEHQLGRALEVCRNLGSWKVRFVLFSWLR